ncbi:galactose-binding domain-containing protein [Aureicoccus marinus]|uniref:Fibronectin type-III domain-containing protein n=1 Tax=Aureicoccus marinus TaxID=754435 RepID=A0A2S7T6L2_9FLAO|nr:discoidin domain-containing protein [Aureicoccus marinus]PQJ15314.1 hypothetical protein BST99_05800 [Aureicoccus marinus]
MKTVLKFLFTLIAVLIGHSIQAQTTYSYTLYDGDTDQPLLSGFNNNISWDLDISNRLSVVSDIASGIYTQVKFTLSNGHTQTEGAHPYACYGDTSGNFTPWTQTAEEAVSFTVQYLNGPGNITETDNFTITFFRSSTSGGGGSSFPNVALNKSTSQSSTWNGYTSDQAVDGITTGNNWTHTINGANPWWRVDLGQAYDIDQIKVINRPSSCCVGRLNGAVVYVGNQDSSDPSDYTAVYNLNGDLVQDIQNLSVSGRYVMIHKTTGQGILNITEVEVHGQVTTAPPPKPSTPTTFYASNPTDTSIDLNWNASTITSGSISHYEIDIDPSTTINVGNSTNTTINSLSPGVTYTFAVRAVSDQGVSSDPTDDLSATTTDSSSGGGGSGGGSSTSLWTQSGNDVSFSSGKVGIGTSTPDENLHVVGNQRIQGDNASLFIKGTGEDDYNGGRIFLNTEYINSGNNFASAKISMHRGTNGTGHFEIQRTAGNGAYMGNLLRYKDAEGWRFFTANSNTSTSSSLQMQISHQGNVSIGTLLVGDWKLAVDGKIRAREIRVDNDAWPDFVFVSDYDLPTLDEIRNFIKKYGHLPAVPSAKEVEEEGVELGEMNKILLQKIEELTLYILELDEQVKELEKGSK